MRKLLLSLLVLALAYVSDATAKTVGDVTLPDSYNAGGANLLLNGAGMRKKGGFIKVYAGGLYLKAKSANAAQIIAADEPMVIKMVFVRTVDSQTIQNAWSEGYKNNAGASYNALLPKIKEFNAFFSAKVMEKNTYDVIYVPGKGISVKINGVEKGTIAGLDFKKATFAIWLGSKPADDGLKEGMLGK
ncbi:MAG TPA: chalcone isomerase family protein [Spirochaetota bacterium]|nr:chalcone isomerase family protein [Spirochaetota bacterium]HSA14833.1 chalcone isomerase family protein [Spirochaetota bacterium]